MVFLALSFALGQLAWDAKPLSLSRSGVFPGFTSFWSLAGFDPRG